MIISLPLSHVYTIIFGPALSCVLYLAAVEYRLQTLQRDWIIAVTDAGQPIYQPLPIYYPLPPPHEGHSWNLTLL